MDKNGPICEILGGKWKISPFLLYTTRSQHAVIENSHSQRGKSEQALLKLLKSYCKVLALPAHEFQVEVRVFN